MSKHRPLLISLIAGYFFFFHVAVVLSEHMMLAVELSEAYIVSGYGAFRAEYNATVRVHLLYSLLRALGTLVILVGLWRMRYWGLYGFTIFCGYWLSVMLTAKHINVLHTTFMAVCLVLAWYAFGRKPRKVIERPDTHVYSGTVQRGSHEPKSAVDELIY